MKRLFSILLVLSLMAICLLGSALADEFTVHSGVKFGMTVDEVVAAETAAGFNPEIKNENQAGNDRFYNCEDKHLTTQFVEVDGQIAGQNDSSVIYHFNKTDGRLNSSVYEFYISPDTFNILRENLIKKYGEPDTGLSAAFHSILKPDAYNFIDYCKPYSKITYHYDDMWLIPQDDESYILISGICARIVISGSAYTFSYIGYQKYSKEEIDDTLSTITTDVNTYNDQLNNDL